MPPDRARQILAQHWGTGVTLPWGLWSEVTALSRPGELPLDTLHRLAGITALPVGARPFTLVARQFYMELGALRQDDEERRLPV